MVPIRIITLLLSLILSQDCLLGCSCWKVDQWSVQEVIATDLIFKGKVIETTSKDNRRRGFGHGSHEYKTITFSVSQIYKGGLRKRSRREVKVKTGIDGGMCGIDVTIGEIWYIWARKVNGSYHTDICSRSVRTNQSSIFYRDLLDQYDTSTGYQIWRDKDDNVRARGEVRDRKPINNWKFYYPDGELSTEGVYDEQGKKHGDWNYYISNQEVAQILSGDNIFANKKQQINRLDRLCAIVEYKAGDKISTDIKLEKCRDRRY